MADIQPTKTITYKTLDKLEISLDIYLPSNTSKAPILLWFHGGGLLQGHRSQLAPWMRRSPEKYKIAVVSADYRLAPQAGISEICDDVHDCIKFIRSSLSSHVPSDSIDTTKVAVSGSSAGGYLTLLAGLYVDPKPNVILPIYPITDPLGTFFTNPQPPPLGRSMVSREDLKEYLDPNGPQVANNPTDGFRQNMYVRMMHDANLAKLWKVPEGVDAAKKWRLSRNVYERRSAPAYFLMGDADTCVGVEGADEVVGAMLGCGLEVVYERVHGKDHFLDVAPDYENEQFFQFMLKHFK
ncbi:hypothetical protein AC579_1176 [Pseudocercospora musae]|uniref:Alpha/beta hydrolase fold-3 domain-containing protein n=1 Tax=Pseudocercospora musae TaxID=113226 RepID=A0A139HW14_9PEZI|nr:hypothetical protein AC579_1176 [Pseudocercospora musae]